MTWIKAKWLQCQVIQMFFPPTQHEALRYCNHRPIIDIDHYRKCTCSVFLLMVNKHTESKVLLIEGVTNSCASLHDAATSRTSMSALHFPFLHVLWHVHAMMTILSQSCKWLRMAISWGYLVGCKLGWNGGGIICNGYFTVVLVTSVGVSFRK